jgi:hypothetical protein
MSLTSFFMGNGGLGNHPSRYNQFMRSMMVYLTALGGASSLAGAGGGGVAANQLGAKGGGTLLATKGATEAGKLLAAKGAAGAGGTAGGGVAANQLGAFISPGSSGPMYSAGIQSFMGSNPAVIGGVNYSAMGATGTGAAQPASTVAKMMDFYDQYKGIAGQGMDMYQSLKSESPPPGQLQASNTDSGYRSPSYGSSDMDEIYRQIAEYFRRQQQGGPRYT